MAVEPPKLLAVVKLTVRSRCGSLPGQPRSKSVQETRR